MSNSSDLTAPHRVLIPGYELQGELGRGAMSVVYRGSRDGKRYAIKVMRQGPQADATAAALRFRREASAVARLSHPGLVRIEEVGEHAGHAYLVMELVEGENLAERIATGPLPEAALRKVGRGLAAALEAVHRSGLVHRDIKPHNVMLDAQGEVKLIDFGFVTGEQAGGEEASAEMVGTVVYAAPEQLGVLKRPVDGRADLYALGATLFHCATGRPPFVAASSAELIRQHAVASAPSADELNPAVPPVFARIIARLLAKDPDDRYQSAHGLLRDLEDLAELEAQRAAGRPLVLGAHERVGRGVSEAPLVGRAEELGQLRERWAGALDGRGSLVQLDGESGSGKTRLGRELRREAAAAGALVLEGKCQKGDAIPLGPLREALEGLAARLRSLPPEALAGWKVVLARAAGDGKALLARVSRGLGSLLGVTEQHAAPEVERERFYAYFVDFFDALAAERGPLLLHLDDVQWLDDGSLQFLKQLSARVTSLRTLVLTTARSDAESSAAVARVLATLGPDAGHRLHLKPLSPAEGGQLVRALLGDKPVDAAFVDRVVVLANGNPFALGEYVRQLFDRGVLHPAAGGWVVDAKAMTEVALPRDLVQLVLGRLAGLSAATAEVLAAAAIQGLHFDEATVAGALGRSAGIDAALRDAQQASLIEPEGDGAWAFIHDRLLEAAQNLLPAARQTELHQAFAAVYEARSDGSASVVHALARHYANGEPGQNPARAFAAFFAAGQLAAENYANAEAHDFFGRADAVAPGAALSPERQLALAEALGVACTRTAHFADAFRHFERALTLAPNRLAQARIQYLVAQARASEGKDAAAWDDLEKAFVLFGAPQPKSTVGLVLSLWWHWLLALLLGVTGLRYGQAKGEDRERRRLLSQLHAAASILAYMLQRAPTMFLIGIRELHNSHYLGTSAEHARARSFYGALLSLLGLKAAGRRHGLAAIAMGEQLSDRGVTALTRFYYALSLEYAGAVREAEGLGRKAYLEVRKYLSPYEAALSLGDLCYQFHVRGYARTSADLALEGLPMVDAAQNVQQRANQRGIIYAQLTVMGRLSEALAWRKEQLDLVGQSPSVWGTAGVHFSGIYSLYEQQDLGPQLEHHIAEFLSMGMLDYHTRFTYALIGWTRYDQFRRAAPEDRAARRKALKKALFRLSFFAVTPVHRCHLLALKAGLAAEDGAPRRARRLLLKAERDALESDCPWGRFVVRRELARLARKTNDPTAATQEAQAAFDLALDQGWHLRARHLKAEFSLQRRDPGSSTSSGSIVSGTVHLGRSDRRAEALLQISLAMTQSSDVATQARAALDTAVRFLGAERAYLFLKDGAGPLALLAGRDAQGADLAASGYSTTIVKKVFDEKSAVVVAGSEEGELLGSESAVALDLRSIMAAPVQLRDEVLGVVYLDNRLAKGVFTEDDTTTLLAIARQIAFAVQLARAARLEAERQALEKDLALTAAVQSLLLPKADLVQTPHYEMAAWYQPAAVSGGDWWWHEHLSQDRSLFMLGDVTGHGPASAMVTTSVATTFQTLRSLDRSGRLPPLEGKAMLEELNRGLLDLTHGGYQMTMSALEYDRAAGLLRWFAAGAPPIMRMDASGKVDVLQVQSTPLGDEAFALSVVERPLSAGDRVLLFTDGVSELVTTTGRPFGLAGVRKLLVATRAQGAAQVRAAFVERLRELQGGRPQDDDISLIVIDVK